MRTSNKRKANRKRALSAKGGVARKSDVSPRASAAVYDTVKHHVIAAWRRSVEIFQFLPIRIKLSLIIGAVVVLVVGVFSLIVIRNQKVVLMQPVTQVSHMHLLSLAEASADGLLLGRIDEVQEAVLRQRKVAMPGMRRVAIFRMDGSVISAIDSLGRSIKIGDAESREIANLSPSKLVSIERESVFDYYYPIWKERQDNGTSKVIHLGIAHVSYWKKNILRPIERATEMAWGAGLIVVLLSVAGIYLVAKKMVNQIHHISEAARQVSGGNLDVGIAVTSKDELGQLSRDFNDMIQHLREKLQMQKFVSKLTVQMIKDSSRSGGSDAGVQKEVTVLFSDVRNFSAVAEQLDPGEIVKLINVYFDLQTRIIESHGGIVDKFMGDQIMAVFQGEHMADNALRSAVDIQRQIRTLNQKRASEELVVLEVGVGINNGMAVMGNMGSTQRMDYTVIGDVVNVAARLCTAAKAGQIITSYDVAKQVNGFYPTTRLKSTSVKGRVQKIDVCEVDYERSILI